MRRKVIPNGNYMAAGSQPSLRQTEKTHENHSNPAKILAGYRMHTIQRDPSCCKSTIQKEASSVLR